MFLSFLWGQLAPIWSQQHRQTTYTIQSACLQRKAHQFEILYELLVLNPLPQPSDAYCLVQGSSLDYGQSLVDPEFWDEVMIVFYNNAYFIKILDPKNELLAQLGFSSLWQKNTIALTISQTDENQPIVAKMCPFTLYQKSDNQVIHLGQEWGRLPLNADRIPSCIQEGDWFLYFQV